MRQRKRRRASRPAPLMRSKPNLTQLIPSESGPKTSQTRQGQAEKGGRGSSIRGGCWCTIEDENMAQAELACSGVEWQRDFATQPGAIPNFAAVIGAVVLPENVQIAIRTEVDRCRVSTPRALSETELSREIGGRIDTAERIVRRPGVSIRSDSCRPAGRRLSKEDINKALRIGWVSGMIWADEPEVTRIANGEGCSVSSAAES